MILGLICLSVHLSAYFNTRTDRWIFTKFDMNVCHFRQKGISVSAFQFSATDNDNVTDTRTCHVGCSTQTLSSGVSFFLRLACYGLFPCTICCKYCTLFSPRRFAVDTRYLSFIEFVFWRCLLDWFRLAVLDCQICSCVLWQLG
jgi:hypothetical protein